MSDHIDTYLLGEHGEVTTTGWTADELDERYNDYDFAADLPAVILGSPGNGMQTIVSGSKEALIAFGQRIKDVAEAIPDPEKGRRGEYRQLIRDYRRAAMGDSGDSEIAAANEVADALAALLDDSSIWEA